MAFQFEEHDVKKCSDVMSDDPLFCLPSDRVSKVAEIMARRDEGPALIVEDVLTRRLAGIVTDRDLALKIVAVGRDPRNTHVKDVMARKVVTVRADQDLDQALALMKGLQLQQIPVLDANNRLVGVLTYREVEAQVFEELQTKAVLEVSAPAGETTEGNGGPTWEHYY